MTKALVTGGAGFIGSHLVAALLDKGYEVRVFDDLSTGKLENIDPRAEFVRGDIRNYESLVDASQGAEFIFHLAAKVSIAESLKSYDDVHSVNVTGTANVCWAALKNYKKVIFSSSCAVYGDTEIPIKEASPLSPTSPYGVSKLKAEKIAGDFSRVDGLTIICLRYFNVYGLRQHVDSPYAAVIPKFVDCARKNHDVVINGTGEQTRDFIYVDDVVRANLLAMGCNRGRIFNVGTGRETSINQLWSLIKSQTNTLSKAMYAPKTYGEVKRSCADTTLASSDLNFTANTSLSDGLNVIIKCPCSTIGGAVLSYSKGCRFKPDRGLHIF